MPKRSIKAFQPKGLRFYSDADIEKIVAVVGRLPDGKVEHEVTVDDPKKGFRHTISRVPRRQALSERLERAALAYTVFSKLPTKRTPIQIIDDMAAIEAAAAKLIAALHLPEARRLRRPHRRDEKPIASMPDVWRVPLQAQAALEAKQLGGLPKWSGVGLLGDSAHGVYRLHKWARNVQALAKAEARRKKAGQTPRAGRHVGDEELNDLFRDLAGIWTDIFGRQIKTAVGGPLSANPGEAGGPMIRFFSACLKPILKDKTPNNEAIRYRIRLLFPRPDRS